MRYNNFIMQDNVRINVIVNIIRTLVLTLLSFVTFPWVCRYLGDSALGTYTWANTFVAYFLILAKIGIPNLAIRECVKVRDDKEKLSNKVQGFFLLQLITTLISFGLMSIVVFTVPQLKEQNSLIFILSLNFLVGAFSFEWVFIALEKQFYMSVRSIITLTLSAMLIIAFVTNESYLYIYALIAVSVTIFTTIANLIYVRRFISFKKTMPYTYKEYVKPLAILCSLSLVLSTYNQTDTFILGFIDDSKKEVASYSVGIKGIDVIIGIITALSTVFIPRAAYCYQVEDKKYFNNLTKYSINICLFIVLPAIVTMTVLAKPICGLISGTYEFATTNSYYSAPTVLMILSSMMLTYSLADIIYGQILLPSKQEKYYLIALLAGTIINIVFSIVLGKYVFKDNPAIGVAIGTAITDLLIVFFLISKSWKWIKQALFNKNTLKLILANVIIAAVSIVVYLLLDNILSQISIHGALIFVIEMGAVVLIDAIIYIISLYVMKEDLICSFKKKQEVNKNV